MARRAAPEINAGSMADIAFLLLIFFLVTTTMDVDKGLARKLPPIVEEEIDMPPIKKRNLFTVLLNSNNDMLVNDNYMTIGELREAAKKFISNNGVDPESSENPQKAIVSFKGDVGTSYNMYIQVYNELRGAYNDLRNDMTRQKTNGRVLKFEDLDPTTRDSVLREEIKFALPARLSEAEPTKLGK